MPEPVRAEQRYIPGLDGLRALAVLAVIAYHLRIGWAQGGLLGVGVFFTLSGYLITDLLLSQWDATGRLHLGEFWLRRARRLLPALYVMLAVVAGWVAFMDRPLLPALRGMLLAAIGYVSNWWLIAQHSSYFARFGPPSPLGHLWSLAVEEQFYLAWPWLVLLGLRWTRRRGRLRGHLRLAAATLLLAAASASVMALTYHPGDDPTRAYEGTDTRAFGLLIGAALAFVWPSRRLRGDIATVARRLLDTAGIIGLAAIIVLVWRTDEYAPFLYPAGLLLLSVATALVVAVVASPASRLGRALGWRPLRWVGVRSYGIYLWHYPIIVLTTPATGRESLVRGAAQVAGSVAAAALSWRFVEEPIRRGALARRWREVTGGGWRTLGSQGWATVGGATAVAVAAGVGVTGIVPPVAGPAGGTSGVSVRLGTSPPSGVLGPPGSAEGGPSAAGVPPETLFIGHVASPPVVVSRRTGAAAPGGGQTLRTSCRAVVHLGDSTSEGMVSPDYLPDPAQRLAAQYARVGVRAFHPEIAGARSIYPETYDGQPNGYMIAERLVRDGYHGCWVVALGTNDAADVAAGSTVGMAERIERLMSVIGNEPVLWVNVVSLLDTGPYAERAMQRWDETLLRACPQYPNMRVYDWAAVARPDWFIDDGIHYTSAGYAARARLIADALAEAFPAHGAASRRQSSAHPAAGGAVTGCLVR